jgi:hypothetical protein
MSTVFPRSPATAPLAAATTTSQRMALRGRGMLRGYNASYKWTETRSAIVGGALLKKYVGKT